MTSVYNVSNSYGYGVNDENDNNILMMLKKTITISMILSMNKEIASTVGPTTSVKGRITHGPVIVVCHAGRSSIDLSYICVVEGGTWGRGALTSTCSQRLCSSQMSAMASNGSNAPITVVPQVATTKNGSLPWQRPNTHT